MQVRAILLGEIQAVGVSRSRPSRLLALSRGRIQSVWPDDDAVTIPVEPGVEGFDAAHGEILAWGAGGATLYREDGAALERWWLSDRIVRGWCTAPGRVELYTVEILGPPYDRTGHRRLGRAGQPALEGAAIAWGQPPPFGAEGTQPPPEPGQPAALYDGPPGRILPSEPGTRDGIEVLPAGGPALRLSLPGEQILGGSFVSGHDGAAGSGVLVWSRRCLWWFRGSGVLLASCPFEAAWNADIHAVAAAELSAVLLRQGARAVLLGLGSTPTAPPIPILSRSGSRQIAERLLS